MHARNKQMDSKEVETHDATTPGHKEVVFQRSVKRSDDEVLGVEMTLQHPCHPKCPVPWQAQERRQAPYVLHSLLFAGEPPPVTTITIDHVQETSDKFHFSSPPVGGLAIEKRVFTARVVLLLSEWAKVCEKQKSQSV